MTVDAAHAEPPRFETDLPADLRHAIEGEVRFDRGSRALYGTDGSNDRQVPIGVVVPPARDLAKAALIAIGVVGISAVIWGRHDKPSAFAMLR